MTTENVVTKNNAIKHIIHLGIVFLILILMTQLHYMEIAGENLNTARDIFVGMAYIALLAIWFHLVNKRIAQKNIRFLLLCNAVVMAFGMFIEMLQTIIDYSSDALLIQLSGIGLFLPFIIFPLFSFYASLCLGMPEEFEINGKLHFLTLAMVALVVVSITNPLHSLVFTLDVTGQMSPPVITPHIVFYIGLIWIILFVSLRFIVIARFATRTGNIKIFALLFLLLAALIAYTIPNIAIGFTMKWEFAGNVQLAYFTEILTWEICIITGMFPVNYGYKEIFARSRLKFRIYDTKGNVFAASEIAKEDTATPTPEELTKLFENGTLSVDKDTILHSVPLDCKHGKGYVTWKEDIHTLNKMNEELALVNVELEKEKEILREELAIQNEIEEEKQHKKLMALLERQVGRDVNELHLLVRKAENDKNMKTALSKVVLKGIFVKRKDNLVILGEKEKYADSYELALTFNEIAKGLELLGIESTVDIPSGVQTEITDMIECLTFVETILKGTPDNATFHITFRLTTDNNDNYFIVSTNQETGITPIFEKLNLKRIPDNLC